MGGKNVYRRIRCAFDLSSDLHNHVRSLANGNRNAAREEKKKKLYIFAVVRADTRRLKIVRRDARGKDEYPPLYIYVRVYTTFSVFEAGVE